MSPHGIQPQPSDAIASLGDGSVVIGIRGSSGSEPVGQWSCVGFGFDAGFEIEEGDLYNKESSVLAGVEEATLCEFMSNLSRFGVSIAGSDDKSDDGIPVLWWINCPSEWFWYLCRREQQIRSGPSEIDDDGGAASETDGSMCAVGGQLSSGHGLLS